MLSILELSLKYGVSPEKVQGIADDLGADTEEIGFEIDDRFKRAVYDIKRNGISAFATAYYIDLLITGDDARADALAAITKDKGHALNQAWKNADWRTIERDKLPGAQIWLDRASDPATKDQEAFERLAQWCKLVLDRSEGEKDYAYLAVRLLLSMPAKTMLAYPKAIQSALNRVKHYGYLDGHWRLEKDAKGKAKTIFHAAKISLDL